jgi:Chaperone of endosialidase
MKSPILFVIVVVVAVSFTAPVNAQFADDNVNSDANGNTAAGSDALFTLSPSNESSLACNSYSQCASNTALGHNALYDNTTGAFNVAAGAGALYDNTTGEGNTAVGASALTANQSGYYNSALGTYAFWTGTGSYNTALGAFAMSNAGTGSYNTASGYEALNDNSTGAYNVASGSEALYSNTTADYSTASGYQALYQSNAVSNTASGYQALYADKSGADNTAMGVHALADNSSGSSNIGIGYHGGLNLTTGSNNIDIGSPGVAAESGVIRIGTITGMTSTQSATYIAGIYGKTSSGGLPVVIDANGLLGTTTSSARFKTAIEPMGSNTAKLQQLRPVTFHLKSDPTGDVQYGLIAEEVATIYPELVVRDQNGRIDGVRYDELAPMLLNEMQIDKATIAKQNEKIVSLEQHIAELNDLKQEMHAALEALKTKDQLVAQR